MGSIIEQDAGMGSLGFEVSDDGSLVELSLRQYDQLTPAGIVRRALEAGVGSRETLFILRRKGFSDVKLDDVTDARDIIRQELAEEYAFSKVEAKALILRRADRVASRLMYEVENGNVRVAKDLAALLKLQATVYGLDKNEDSMTDKLTKELDAVNSQSKNSHAAVPKVSDGNSERVRAAIEKHSSYLMEDQHE